MQILRDANRDVPLHELASALDVHSSTAYRLLASLQDAGFVTRDPVTNHYRLGLEPVTMSGIVLARVDVLRVADPELRRLARNTNETVNFGIRYGDELLNVEQIAAADRFRSFGWLGQRAPLYLGSAARSLTAHLPEGDVSGILSRLRDRRAELDIDAFQADLTTIRSRGYAINRGEINPDIYSVGAPILGRDGYACAAVSIVGYRTRFSEQRITELIPTLLRSTETISQQLGYANHGIPRFA
jgi:DNA-binding IclR family transcriptional regulator